MSSIIYFNRELSSQGVSFSTSRFLEWCHVLLVKSLTLFDSYIFLSKFIENILETSLSLNSKLTLSLLLVSILSLFRLCAPMVAAVVILVRSRLIVFKIVYAVICHKLPNPWVSDVKINNIFVTLSMTCGAVFYGRTKQNAMNKVSFLSNRSLARLLPYFMSLLFIRL